MKHMRSHIKSNIQLLIFLERNNKRLEKQSPDNKFCRLMESSSDEIGLRLPVFLLTLPDMPLV